MEVYKLPDKEFKITNESSSVNYKKTQINSLRILGKQYMKEELVEWFKKDIQTIKKNPRVINGAEECND